MLGVLLEFVKAVVRKLKRLGLNVTDVLASDPAAVCKVSCYQFYSML